MGLCGVLVKAPPALARATSSWSGDEGSDELGFEAPTLQDPNEALEEARRESAGATAEAEGAATQALPTPPTTPPPPPVPPLG
jgi:hypothetical protein